MQKNDSQKGAMLAILVIISIVALVIIAQKTKLGSQSVASDIIGQVTESDIDTQGIELVRPQVEMELAAIAALKEGGVSEYSIYTNKPKDHIEVKFLYQMISPEQMVVIHNAVLRRTSKYVHVQIDQYELSLRMDR